ncbi:MAG: sulfite exporter TauE/SafE family protein, partial [Desulfurococcaceae archaeon]
MGVGGGEFRIPVLLRVIDLPAVKAVAVNSLVGLLVVVVSFLRRLQLGLLNSYYFNTAFTMSISSIAGSYLGAHLTDRIPEKELKSVLAVYLVVVGLKIITEPFFEASLSLTFAKDFVKETVLAALIGLAIGIISGHFGVAGGEFRIPALVYIF